MGNVLTNPRAAFYRIKRRNRVYPAPSSVEMPSKPISAVSETQRTLSRPSFQRMSSLRISSRKTDSSQTNIMVRSDDGKKSLFVDIDDKVLSRYTVQGLAGRGAFSSVLKMTSKDCSGEFAMKVIEKTAGGTSATWETELAVLKRVRHPNIAYLHEVLVTNKQAYFILQLAAGGDLASKIKSVGSLGEHRSRQLAAMILSALEYMHRHGITHRDLKPENCLLLTDQPDSLLVVSDFGLAHMTTDGKPSEEAGNHTFAPPLCFIIFYMYSAGSSQLGFRTWSRLLY